MIIYICSIYDDAFGTHLIAQKSFFKKKLAEKWGYKFVCKRRKLEDWMYEVTQKYIVD